MTKKVKITSFATSKSLPQTPQKRRMTHRDMQSTTLRSYVIGDAVQSENEAGDVILSSPITLEAAGDPDDDVTIIATFGNTIEKLGLMVFEDTLFQDDSDFFDNIIPGGSDVDSSDYYIYGPHNALLNVVDEENPDYRRSYYEIYVRNLAASTRTIVWALNVRYILNEGGVVESQ